jgi:hypothetical protein
LLGRLVLAICSISLSVMLIIYIIFLLAELVEEGPFF